MKNFTLSITAALAMLATAGSMMAQAPQHMLQGKQLDPEARLKVYEQKAQEQINSLAIKQQPMRSPAKIQEFDEPEVILYEDFSLMTAGSEAEPDATMLPEDYWVNGNEFLPDGYTLTSGWWGLGIYQAGGTCFLGYPGMGGIITTPCLNLNGRIRITFRMKPGANVTNSASIIMSVLKGDQYNPEYAIDDYEFISLAAGEDWTEYEFTYDVGYGGDDAYVQFNGMMYDNGKYIDDIKIERLGYILAAPEAYAPNDYTGHSFTASWNTQGATNEYLLNVYKRTVPESDTTTEESTDFSSGHRCIFSRWIFNLYIYQGKHPR